MNNELQLLNLHGTVESMRAGFLRLKLKPPGDVNDLCVPFAKCSVSHLTPEAELLRVTQAFQNLFLKDFDGCLQSLMRRIQRLNIRSRSNMSWNTMGELAYKLSRLQAVDDAESVELCQKALQNITLMTHHERTTQHLTADLRKLSFG